jgi:PAS domain S-box-containing protein
MGDTGKTRAQLCHELAAARQHLAQLELDLAAREEALRKAHDELEKRVADRTAELSAGKARLESELAERQRAEAAQRYSENWYRAIFEDAVHGIALTDVQHRLVASNPALQRMLGYTEAELHGMSISELTHPDDLPVELALFNELIGNQRPAYELEKRCRCKDGSDVWAHVSVSVARREGNEPRLLIGMIEDITQRKWAEDALRQNEATLRSFYDSSPQAMGVIEVVGDELLHISSNAGAAQMCGLPPEAMLGRQASQTGLFDDRQAWIRQLERCERLGEPVHFDYVRRTASGPRWLSATVCPVTRFAASQQHFAFLIEDITESHLVEQLAVSRERARLARELHDSVVQSLYSVTLLSEGARRLAAGGHMERIADHLVQISEGGHHALREMRLLVHQLRPVALEQAGLVGALRQRLEAVEKRSGIQVTLEAPEGLRLPGRLEEELYRIASEALNNSLKHAAATAVRVVITSNKQRLALSVSDNGRGCDPAAASANGGLGLVTMQQRADVLGGQLSVCSAPGAGTTVTISIPQ